MTGRNLHMVGEEGERLAADFLRKKGYKILEQNYRIRQSEIDLIVKDGDTIVFVEVKYRKGNGQGTPQEAVTLQKQRRISRCAVHYLTTHGLWEQTACRFDVVAVENGQITHIENAFDFQG